MSSPDPARKLAGRHIVIMVGLNYVPSMGVYARIKRFACAYLEAGARVSLVCWDRYGEDPVAQNDDGVEVHRVRVPSEYQKGPAQIFKLLRFLFKAFGLLRTLKPDAIDCHNIDSLPAAIPYRFIYRTKVALDAHEPVYYGLWPKKFHFLLPLIHFVEAVMARRCDLITVTNDFQLKKYRNWGVKNVHLIGNYPARNIVAKSLDETKFSKDGCVFARFGTIYHDDNCIKEVVDAFRELKARGVSSDLVLAGRVAETYKARFEELIAPIKDEVKVLGEYSSSDLNALYSGVDVSLLIYKRDVWFEHITPSKFYESMANGVPMIMTDIGGLGKTINDLQLGLLADEEDVSDLSRKMEQLATDTSLRKLLSKNCLAAAEQAFNWENMSSKLVDCYDRMIK